jgi:hypothetical protein
LTSTLSGHPRQHRDDPVAQFDPALIERFSDRLQDVHPSQNRVRGVEERLIDGAASSCALEYRPLAQTSSSTSNVQGGVHVQVQVNVNA